MGYLNHVIRSFTQLLTVHDFAQNIDIFIRQKCHLRNDYIVSLSWYFDYLYYLGEAAYEK